MEVKEKKSKNSKTKDVWEFKDRTYILKGDLKPLTLRMQSKSTRRNPLLWFDEEAGYQKEIRYATNQQSCFVEDQKGTVLLGHIVFRKGILQVPKENQNLQKLMSLYHPHKNTRYFEYSAVEEAKDELEYLDLQVDAMNIARDMEIDMAEAIMRVEIGSEVSNMSSKEIKRDLVIFASRNPELFLELAEDENVQLRNFGIVACENKVIKLSQDQRTFSWASNGRVLMNVPFDENPYSALAAWFKTDEGVEVYKSIEKKLK
tara:strand:+ start:181 stop:960 length:780 start_codon:yes stop_codon:yes gene_type:complete